MNHLWFNNYLHDDQCEFKKQLTTNNKQFTSIHNKSYLSLIFCWEDDGSNKFFPFPKAAPRVLLVLKPVKVPTPVRLRAASCCNGCSASDQGNQEGEKWPKRLRVFVVFVVVVVVVGFLEDLANRKDQKEILDVNF